jgi:F5/8 type C domain
MASVIDIRPIGNLGNRMLQYLAARKLQAACAGSRILRSHLPEWGLPDPQEAAVGSAFLVRPDMALPFQALVELTRVGTYDAIVLADHMQRMDSLPDAAAAAAIFPPNGESLRTGDDELLINVRAAETVSGVGHYPLVPVEFYWKIIQQTGLRPFFMGQIGQNAYCEKLKAWFPNARFAPSEGAMRDFETIRRARNIVISVSTFSWLAAWLSGAERIFVPMLGFLNPMHFRGRKIIDLLPTTDQRYRFFQFPLHFGVPELQALARHGDITRLCREIAPQQVDFLRRHTPIVDVDTADVDFDEIWYAQQYLDAALEISEGWFAGPLEHYFGVGLRRGNRPMPSGFTMTRPAGLVDHALHCPSRQSSLSEWSVERSVEAEAGRAVAGVPQTPYAFHTDFEHEPWWQVDLGEPRSITCITITNRCETPQIAGRSSPLHVLRSNDGDSWEPLFRTPDGLIPGRNGKPLVWHAEQPVAARFIRITVPRKTYLHLRQVEIMGPKLPGPAG